MQTQAQLRAEVYNALIANSTLNTLLSGRVYWSSRPTVDNTFPLIVYRIFDSPSDYAFGNSSAISEEYTFQIDLYTSPSEISEMDTGIEGIKEAMETLCYRRTSSSIEFLEADIDMIVRPVRWERINV